MPKSDETRHLLYHCYPIKGSVWRLGFDQLATRIELFNGIRACSVALDHRTDSMKEVESYAQELNLRLSFRVYDNNPKLREMIAWGDQWNGLSDRSGPDDLVLYAQNKGVTHALDCRSTPYQWAGLMYSGLLDYFPKVRNLLQDYPIVGMFRKGGYCFGAKFGTWHYSGSFFWSRVGEVQKRRKQTPDHLTPFGCESWPGSAFKMQEAACLFHSGSRRTMSVYNLDYWNATVVPEWFAFVRENQQWRTPRELFRSSGG